LNRKGYNFAILLCDIDFFKEVNDNYGHECGDELLVSLVKVIEGSIRQHDYIGRWGGEEFIVILEDVDEDEAFEIADRMRQNISKNPFRCSKNSDPIFINITIGLTCFNPKKDIKTNIANADNALYFGKKNGRNQTVRHSKI
jgi:diguanylate cyclase (GGDEF)-like protein